jgi:hypothetical protein
VAEATGNTGSWRKSHADGHNISVMRKTGWILAIAVLLSTGGLGLINGVDEVATAETSLQRSVSIAVIGYGVLGVIAAVALMRRQRWSMILSVGWTMCVIYAATVSSFAYHDPSIAEPGTRAGIAGAFLGTLLLGALIVWAARAST